MHFFSTGIERQHVARLIESDLVDISFYLLASSCIYAGWHVPELVNTRTEFCDVVHLVQEGIKGYALRKHYSCQKFVKTDDFELKYLFPAQPPPFARHNGKCNICILNKEIKLFEG